jgi:hypothetical protein
MGERIDQFCENLRTKHLGAKIDSKAQTAEYDAPTLDAAKKRIEQDRVKVTAAQSDMKKWDRRQQPPKNRRVESAKKHIPAGGQSCEIV